MSESASYGLRKINSYDIFANIVPGFVFSLGLILLLHITPLVRALFGNPGNFSFGISHLILLVVVSFVFGQLLQAIGSRVDGDHGFPNLMRRIRGEDVENRYSMTEFEEGFWDRCSKEFGLSEDFSSYNRLFKAILAFLEASGRRRALRMQALYLFSRGFVVALKLLAFYYFIIWISLYYNYIPNYWLPIFRAEWLFPIAALVSYFVSLQVDKEREELEADWIKYTVLEFCLETQ